MLLELIYSACFGIGIWSGRRWCSQQAHSGIIFIFIFLSSEYSSIGVTLCGWCSRLQGSLPVLFFKFIFLNIFLNIFFSVPFVVFFASCLWHRKLLMYCFYNMTASWLVLRVTAWCFVYLLILTNFFPVGPWSLEFADPQLSLVSFPFCIFPPCPLAFFCLDKRTVFESKPNKRFESHKLKVQETGWVETDKVARYLAKSVQDSESGVHGGLERWRCRLITIRCFVTSLSCLGGSCLTVNPFCMQADEACATVLQFLPFPARSLQNYGLRVFDSLVTSFMCVFRESLARSVYYFVRKNCWHFNYKFPSLCSTA